MTGVRQGWQPATCSHPRSGDWGGGEANHGVAGSNGDGDGCLEETVERGNYRCSHRV